MSTYTYGYYGLLKLIKDIDENIALTIECEGDKYLFAVIGEDNNTLFVTSDKRPNTCCNKTVDYLRKKYNKYT